VMVWRFLPARGAPEMADDAATAVAAGSETPVAGE
jgi:hypothetical protein